MSRQATKLDLVAIARRVGAPVSPRWTVEAIRECLFRELDRQDLRNRASAQEITRLRIELNEAKKTIAARGWEVSP